MGPWKLPLYLAPPSLSFSRMLITLPSLNPQFLWTADEVPHRISPSNDHKHSEIPLQTRYNNPNNAENLKHHHLTSSSIVELLLVRIYKSPSSSSSWASPDKGVTVCLLPVVLSMFPRRASRVALIFICFYFFVAECARVRACHYPKRVSLSLLWPVSYSFDSLCPVVCKTKKSKTHNLSV